MARFRPGDPPPKPVSDVVERAVEKAEKSSRMVSKKQFCELTGFDRHTLDDWINKKGAPVEKTGSSGDPYMIDIKAIWKWREEYVVKEALKKAVPDGDDVIGFMGIKDPYKAIQAQERYINMGIKKKKLVHQDDMMAAIERAMGVIRQSVMAVPERLFREMAGFPQEYIVKWRLDAKKSCADALAEGARIIQDAVPKED